LAPVQKKSLKPTSDKMVHVSKRLPGISLSKIIRPSSEDHVHVFEHLPKVFLYPLPGLVLNLVSQTRYGLLGRNNIQVLPVSSLQVPVIAKGKSQKI